MTQQTTQQTCMSATDFDERHYRTGQCIARVGKLWEQVAEEQQAIIDGQGYKHMNYDSWKEYWDTEWKEASGWTWKTIEHWMQARRIQSETPTPGTGGYTPRGADQWRELAPLAPEERTEFLNRYEEFKPTVTGGGHPFRAAIKEFKGERQPTVREVVPPEEMANLPSPDLSESEKWVFQPGKTQMALQRLDPDAVADDAHRLLGTKVNHEVETINYIIDWYASYRQAILSRKNKGLRAVQ